MDQDVAKIFRESLAVSTTQGSSYNMMKASSKRRRPRAQIEEEKRTEEARKAEIEEKLERMDQLEQ